MIIIVGQLCRRDCKVPTTFINLGFSQSDSLGEAFAEVFYYPFLYLMDLFMVLVHPCQYAECD